MDLKEFFSLHPKAALAFSGGTDSAYLLYEGLRLGADIRPYYARSQFQPEFEYEDARRLANELGVEMSVIELDALAIDNIRQNPFDRCYYCKSSMLSKLRERAAADGYTTVIDGTNASDDVSDRPGMRALKEQGILSPLRLCDISKTDVRALSREAGLFTWDKPSYSCLATRMMPGREIQAEDLRRVEKAEGILHSLGFEDVRLRMREGHALLQLPSSRLEEGQTRLDEIRLAVSDIFPTVLLDEKGR